MADDFESLLESMVPGASSARSLTDPDAPAFPASLDLQPVELLGRGAVGFVYRAHDPVMQRDVAVKISRPDGGEAARRSLLAEVQLTARLQHPAVLPVHRVQAANGLLCAIFQLAPRTTLGARIDAAVEGEDWPLPDRLTALYGVAGAVARAHEVGVVHGDLHPGNVLLGDQGEPYVLDWGTESMQGSLSGNAAYAAPECLRGEPPGTAADVFALGALLFEVVGLHPLRSRRRGEDLGAFVARWSEAPLPALEGPQELASLVASALGTERPTAAEFRDALGRVLTGHAIRDRRVAEARQLLADAREALARFHDRATRIAREEQVAAVQGAKVLGHAPIAQKKPLWQTEDRVAALRAERDDLWLDAAEAATRVTTLAPVDHPVRDEARALVAELWWERMLAAEAQPDDADAARAERMVREYDDGGTWVRMLDAPAQVSLDCDQPNATVTIARFVERDRVLIAEVEAELPMPLREQAVRPGSLLLTVRAGDREARYPLLLRRVEHHRGSVRLFRPEQIGAGWVHVPAGPYRLGGDPRARQPLAACEPHLDDRFVQRTCVTCAEWLTFLNDLPVDEARNHVPGEAGLFGSGFRAYWEHDGTAWVLPAVFDPRWPVMSVSLGDIEAYAAWLSEREGREVRLPTEEEWEKAARGVDGRSYPWGDHFDPTFAHMRQSKAGPPTPWPVGDYPVDTSVYGCRDMAGGMREITATVFDEGQMVMRGGTWGDDGDDLRCANRSGIQPEFRYAFVSFRLISDATRP